MAFVHGLLQCGSNHARVQATSLSVRLHSILPFEARRDDLRGASSNAPSGMFGKVRRQFR